MPFPEPFEGRPGRWGRRLRLMEAVAIGALTVFGLVAAFYGLTRWLLG